MRMGYECTYAPILKYEDELQYHYEAMNGNYITYIAVIAQFILTVFATGKENSKVTFAESRWTSKSSIKYVNVC